MKDLSRGEEELRQLIDKKADAISEKKWLRLKRTFFVLSGVVYLQALYLGLDADIIDMEYLITSLLAAPVVAGFIMLISYGVLYYIITGAMEDEKSLAKLVGELNAVIRLKKL